MTAFRRLILLLAAVTAVALGVLGVATAPAQHAPSAQDRTRGFNAAAQLRTGGFNPAAQLLVGGQTAGSPSTRPVSFIPTTQIAVGCCVATEEAGGLADEGETVYRVHGGGSGPGGSSWTPVDPTTLENPRDALGLPDANSGEYLTTGRVLDWTGVVGRRALPLDGNAGGAPEYLFPDPEGQIQHIGTQPLNPPF